MTDAALAIQKAVYASVTGDSAIMAKVTAVRDYSPDNQALPYIEIGEIDATDWSSKTFEGQEHTIALHVWSRARGKQEALEITGMLHDLLHRANLTLDGNELVTFRFEFRTAQFEPDGKTIQSIIRFRARTIAQ